MLPHSLSIGNCNWVCVLCSLAFPNAYLDFCKSGYNECLSFLFLVNHLSFDKNGGKV